MGIAIAVAALGLLAFAGLVGAAMLRYPGGTWTNPKEQGHRFWTNYLCDLLQPTALGGAPNASSARLARAGMVGFAPGIAAFFWVLTTFFVDRSALALAVRAAGVIAGLGLVGVALTPSQQAPKLHAVSVLGAAVVGLAAAVASVVGLVGAQPTLALLGGTTLVVGAVDTALFAHEVISKGPSRVATPVLQRLATLCALAWMTTAVWLASAG